MKLTFVVKLIFKQLVILAIILLAGCQIDCPENLVFEATKIQQIKQAQGCEATVTGIVMNTYFSVEKQIVFLNLGNKDYHKAFSVVIFGKSLPRFEKAGISSPNKYYYNASIQVTGTITQYKGRPQIIVASPEQIKTLNY